MGIFEFQEIGSAVVASAHTCATEPCGHNRSFDPVPADCFNYGEQLVRCCDCGQTMTQRIARLYFDGLIHR
ncbi:hypothetical protein [Acidovorax sp. NCPPB 4044]|uniref:hypothetical protein n=1 Tax=Acidovorax sp. NCPPB 4044 TaxID=2940490 RepID=UPI002303BC03|nr:hypothetical protein [Acidovorax sp. NCPPB 4044]MDA8521980.1 hypothetical protein [Acidovorax sp. NCPPB 4044]